MLEFWKTLLDHLEHNHPVFLAMVAAHSQGSPGVTGAKLGIVATGEIFGTIGGGVMEHNIIEYGRQMLAQGEFVPRLQTLHHRLAGEGEKSGMICAGSQTNLYYLCRPDRDRKTLAKVLHLRAADVSAYLYITSLGMAIIEEPMDLSQPKIKLYQGDDHWQYREQLRNCDRIAIIGGGHCSLALSQVMAQLDYEVFVFDTRAQVTTLNHNNYVRSIQIMQDYQDVGAAIDLPEMTAVVVMTTDFASDIRALLGVLSFPFPFIGVMGSRAKIATIFAQLQQAGISPSALSKLYAPVGLPIHSHTPAEIAISIAAQVLQERVKFTR
ncbi:XdhC family protein [Pseudanabaena mucicola]|uniref:XdhC family protein n=1 Tax=Pseudanabaena mucicola FACHB-723 TaxID=2692860 RepID=A0ABR7ZW32_9CYAN|nr:XdhC/CoxI family protein [Pseudanabaena mucicola]MBD2188027.1 XdhC family protein [Pseudanabaena mucicola FACHB-723]